MTQNHLLKRFDLVNTAITMLKICEGMNAYVFKIFIYIHTYTYI